MKSIVISLFLIVGGLYCKGQDKPIKELENIFRVTFLAPGIEVELPITGKSTMLVKAFLEGGFKYDYLTVPPPFYPYIPGVLNPTSEKEFSYIIHPGLRVAFRRFYNFQSRVATGRNVEGNSGNFIAIDLQTNFEDIIRTTGYGPKDYINFIISPQWGIQRAFRWFHLSCSAGPSLYFDTNGRVDFSYLSLIIRLGIDFKRW